MHLEEGSSVELFWQVVDIQCKFECISVTILLLYAHNAKQWSLRCITVCILLVKIALMLVHWHDHPVAVKLFEDVLALARDQLGKFEADLSQQAFLPALIVDMEELSHVVIRVSHTVVDHDR